MNGLHPLWSTLCRTLPADTCQASTLSSVSELLETHCYKPSASLTVGVVRDLSVTSKSDLSFVVGFEDCVKFLDQVVEMSPRVSTSDTGPYA